ncbi:exonuclease domain-containing protein [Fulvimarina sp. 2208YS6-2-32]|uniref:Exonuclease domain-containing protein n=1 Tax=Fulvimarina uroteuthidis TaxID=3098149 RepID=A0ABU5I3C8_9HYPH|nr:exonuclease domain-containing protein [Fulvimarina sp. 2208YS6-2-32]MDY8109473.1 exonuclease domain-containing protein [Fulvimarina sp. 2208YS6-2-32]
MTELFPPAPKARSLFDEPGSTLVRIIDTETAGQKLEEDAVIEIGSVDLDLKTGAIFNPMQTFCDPAGVEISAGARKVHQISNEMLVGAPTFAEAVVPFSTGTFAAQRADFDRSRLRLTGRWLCTYKLALRAFPDVKAHGLQSLVKYVPLDLSGVSALLSGLHPHRALFDAVCTAVLMRRIAETLMPRCQDLDDFLERAETVSNEPALLARLRFGRHRGIPIRQVPSDYLEWLVAEPQMSADAVFTAKRALATRQMRGERVLPGAERKTGEP